MTNTTKRNLPLLFPKDTAKSSSPYSPPGGGGLSNNAKIQRDRVKHAEKLKNAFTEIQGAAKAISKEHAIYLSMEISSEKIDILGKANAPFFPKTSGLKCINIEAPQNEKEPLTATFLLTENKGKNNFLNKLENYSASPTLSKKYEERFDAINKIKATTLKDLFANPSEFPTDITKKDWWELWFNQEVQHKDDFLKILKNQNITPAQHPVSFVESEVMLICASIKELEEAISQYPSLITSIRKYQAMNDFFLNMKNIAQTGQIDKLKKRTQSNLHKNAPSICILDSGIFQKHPLIEDFLKPKDCHTTHAHKNTQDLNGHGTRMAGLALYGDLNLALQTTSNLTISYHIESVKIQDPTASPELSAQHTNQALSLAQIEAPHRKRLICMALTDDAKTPEPSSWSAEVDNLAFGTNGNAYLFVISAGNTESDYPHQEYLIKNDLSPVQNPAQAWNALTVGAFTEKRNINNPILKDYKPLAPEGDLSPYSTTSLLWDNPWPIKPEIVMEGGNYAIEPNNPNISDAAENLHLLTTAKNYSPTNFFTTHADTSAATALASKLTAELMAKYPALSPQAIRCLIIHSARWTPAMKKYLQDKSKTVKECSLTLLRRYGYGVPSFERAALCLKNDATLLIDGEIQPFPSKAQKKQNSSTYHEMIWHDLPWPQKILESLAEKKVRMRVTLSYFIEPNPNVNNRLKKHRAQAYQSFGLRFDVKRADESQDNFIKRLNNAERNNIIVEEKQKKESLPSTNAIAWKLGINNRNKGSIHSDIWEGTGAELAACGQIAIYPVGGWWSYLQQENHDGQKVPYALAISLETSEDIDLYAEIKSQINLSVSNQVQV